MGYGEEVEMIRTAHEMGLLTTPYAFNPEEGEQMAAAGADIVVAHAGLTTKGAIGATTALTLAESVGFVQAICDAARGVSKEVIVLCHGGADFRARRRRVRVAKYDGRRWFLRRVEHGAVAGGGGHYRAREEVQGHPLLIRPD